MAFYVRLGSLFNVMGSLIHHYLFAYAVYRLNFTYDFYLQEHGRETSILIIPKYHHSGLHACLLKRTADSIRRTKVGLGTTAEASDSRLPRENPCMAMPSRSINLIKKLLGLNSSHVYAFRHEFLGDTSHERKKLVEYCLVFS
uniref:Uncharacterized protein n=1 Tax=Cucumis melo TaxID=3656 RepID=A0A9I9E5C1_CUCME